ncbi:MAG: MscS Mechanosensitive ion channel, partial [Acidobacteria bacterium]|nr:MscS Mechanosensitive ion channel [Acidobacteriota bacterium]
GSIWLFSADTLEAVPDLYEEVTGGSVVERVFPPFFVRTMIVGVPLFGWLVVIVGIPLAYALTGLPVRLLLRLTRRRRPWPSEPGRLASAERPIRMLVVALLVTWLNSTIGFSLRGRQFWASTSTTISIAAVVWLLVVLNARGEKYFRSRLAGRDGAGTASILRLARRTVDVLIVAVGVLVALSYFGIDPTAAVAGLGVGGIAVALAAQKTLENVVAGSSLVFDQAVRVGDYLKVGGYEGTVDDIGLRSTRIRTLDRSVVSVPNGQIAAMSLETLSVRDKFWFHPLLRLRCETTVDQIRRVADGVRALLVEHAAVERESVRVRFLGFGPASLDIEAFAYVVARDWSHFLEIQEGLLFRAMEIVQEAGSRIAIPSQVMYLEGRPPAEAPAAAAANGRPGGALPDREAEDV